MLFQLLFVALLAGVSFAANSYPIWAQVGLLAITLGITAFIEFYLLKRLEFYKVFTISVLVAIFSGIAYFVKEVFGLQAQLPLSDNANTVATLYGVLFAFYIAFQVGASSVYFRKRTPATNRSEPYIIDTCAIIDGRLLDISKTGFVPKTILIPEFVIREMQLISDSSNHEKRTKGRRGLDILKDMKNSDTLSIQIINEDYPKMRGVDNKLLQMAKDKNAKIITTDYNLFKVADVEGVKVLNINHLASILKPAYTPGDKIKVTISKKGNNKRQGIGYLENDTMIVVEDGEKHIGSSKYVLVTSYIQNDSGRIAFCKLLQ